MFWYSTVNTLHFIFPSSPSAPYLYKLIRKPGCPFLGHWWKVKPNVGNFTSVPSWTKTPSQFPFSALSCPSWTCWGASLLSTERIILWIIMIFILFCHVCATIWSVSTLKPNFQCVGGNLLESENLPNLQSDYNNLITG